MEQCSSIHRHASQIFVKLAAGYHVCNGLGTAYLPPDFPEGNTDSMASPFDDAFGQREIELSDGCRSNASAAGLEPGNTFLFNEEGAEPLKGAATGSGRASRTCTYNNDVEIRHETSLKGDSISFIGLKRANETDILKQHFVSASPRMFFSLFKLDENHLCSEHFCHEFT
jgi:hypothetical protein